MCANLRWRREAAGEAAEADCGGSYTQYTVRHTITHRRVSQLTHTNIHVQVFYGGFLRINAARNLPYGESSSATSSHISIGTGGGRRRPRTVPRTSAIGAVCFSSTTMCEVTNGASINVARVSTDRNFDMLYGPPKNCNVIRGGAAWTSHTPYSSRAICVNSEVKYAESAVGEAMIYPFAHPREQKFPCTTYFRAYVS